MSTRTLSPPRPTPAGIRRPRTADTPRVVVVPAQQTLDDIGTALHTVDFCVVDLETTGGAPEDFGITEIGAVRVRGGQVQAEFGTLVNPGQPIPAYISVLTGITDATVAGAPRISSALPAFLEFAHGCVLVAHNAPYDTGFLRAASEHLDYPWQPRAVLDTVRLSRAVLPRGEVPNHKLATLAQHFRASTRPTHRALDDARATVDVLHRLLERVGSLGVTTLEEVLHYSGKVAERTRRKRTLADDLPAAPGVYVFTDAQGESLYVGTSTNIRSRVRTYFTASEQRSRMAEMVGLAESVTPIVCATPLEAAVRELRLIAERKPRYNRRSRFPERARWLKLTVEAAPRLSLVKAAKDDAAAGAAYLGPMSSRVADDIKDVLGLATSLRTCAERLTITSDRTPCGLAGLGRCAAPCTGGAAISAYASAADAARLAMTSDAGAVTSAVRERIRTLSDAQRYEEAGAWLSKLESFLRITDRTQRRQSLVDAGQVVAAAPDGAGGWEMHVIRHGRLAAALASPRGADHRAAAAAVLASAEEIVAPTGPGPAGLVEETDLILRWLDAPGLRLIKVSGTWAMPRAAAGRDRHALRAGPAHPATDHPATDHPPQALEDTSIQLSSKAPARPESIASAATGIARARRSAGSSSTDP